MRRLLLARWLAVSVLAAVMTTCSDDDSSSPAANVGATKPAQKRKLVQAGIAVDAPEQGGASTPSTADARSAGLLELVPGNAMLVARWPTFRAAEGAWKESALVQGLVRAGLQAAAQAVVDPIASLAAVMRPALSAAERPLVEALVSLRGDVVVALLDVDPTRMTDSGPASTWLAIASHDGPDEPWTALLDRAASRTNSKVECKRVAPGHYALTDGADHAEIRVRDDRIEFLFNHGTIGLSLEQTVASDAAHSFATAPVYAEVPRAAGLPWLEIHANAAPLFDLVRKLEGPDVGAGLTALGFDGVLGASASFALDGALLRNQFAFASTDRRDVFSSCFRSDAVDPSFARLVPDDAEKAVMLGFDLAAAVDSIRAHLPTEDRPRFDATLARFEEHTGLDVRSALLENLGPNVMFMSRGNLAQAVTQSDLYDAALAIQVRNESAAQALLGMAFEANPAALKPRSAGDLRYVSVALPVPELAWLDLSVGIHDGLLVLATSGAVLEEVFTNAKGTDVRCAPLAAALGNAPKDAFYVSTSDTRSEIEGMFELVRSGAIDDAAASPIPFELPTTEQLREFCMGLGHSTETMRASQHTLVYESAGAVNLPINGVPALAIIASIAIPKLMSARVEANEAAAIATLRNVCSAQAQFQAIAVKDRDGDGMGEYGSFAELTGSIALPDGTRLDPPMLSKSLAEIESGCVSRNGYLYACILPGRNGQPIPETDRGGAGGDVDTELAELYFTIYAWPIDAGTTGVRAFAIDQSGDIYQTYSMGFDPPVSGLESPPPLDDAFDFDTRFQASQHGRLQFVWEPLR